MGKHQKLLYCFLSVAFVIFWMSTSQISCFYSDSIGLILHFKTGKRPIIVELSKAKNFFIDQSASIDLASYASAWDEIDGDISHNIKIITSPAFEYNKSASYTVTYSVTNSNGFKAIPLVTNIVVWDFSKIVSGNYHSLALTSNGRVYAWGDNYYGQLGRGNNLSASKPILIEGISEIIDIAAGTYSSYALDSQGKIYSWGSNDYGQLGDGTSQNKNAPKIINIDEHFVKISAGTASAAAISQRGDLYTWGEGESGSLGNGENKNLYSPTKTSLTKVVDVSINQIHGVAITQGGHLYTWGKNDYGNLGIGGSGGIKPPTMVSYFSGIPIKQVSAGWLHMSAVSMDGRIFTWGYGAYGALGDGSLSIKSIPQEISIPVQLKKTVAGLDYTSAISADGDVYFFGQNGYGKHGSGNNDAHNLPFLLDYQLSATDISLGAYASFVLSESREVYSMGYGGSGALGTGNNNDSSIPLRWAFTPPQPY